MGPLSRWWRSSSKGLGRSGPSPPLPQGAIQPVILYPRGAAQAVPSLIGPIQISMDAVAAWYQSELGRPLRFVGAPTALPADDEALYASNPLEALARAVERQGWPNRAADGRAYVPYIYVGFLPGHGGFAGTVHWPGQAGLAGLGDACLHAIRGRQTECLRIIGGDALRCSVDGQRGAIAHELMHGLGWGEHTETPDLDLSSWEYQFFPRCCLPAPVKRFLLTPPQTVYFV